MSEEETSMTMNKEKKIEPSCSVVGEWSQQLSFILFYKVGIFIFFQTMEKRALGLDVK